MKSIKYVTERRQVNLSKVNGVVSLEVATEVSISGPVELSLLLWLLTTITTHWVPSKCQHFASCEHYCHSLHISERYRCVSFCSEILSHLPKALQLGSGRVRIQIQKWLQGPHSSHHRHGLPQAGGELKATSPQLFQAVTNEAWSHLSWKVALLSTLLPDSLQRVPSLWLHRTSSHKTSRDYFMVSFFCSMIYKLPGTKGPVSHLVIFSQ